MDEKTYCIAGKVYIHRKPVLGQLLQLSLLFDGTELEEISDSVAFAASLGQALPRFLAIVLTPEGQPLHKRNLEELSRELENSCPASTALEVLHDFFAWPKIVEEFSAGNLAVALLGQVIHASATARASSGTSSETTSKTGSSCSAGETLPNESASSGPHTQTK